ncbi:MAG: hypothetical protein FD168_556 [Desulfobulbaceae bacterium]|nr:MAG: hypothetical protein FD168_556 [Desulfobulbaceae bacterium]
MRAQVPLFKRLALSIKTKNKEYEPVSLWTLFLIVQWQMVDDPLADWALEVPISP